MEEQILNLIQAITSFINQSANTKETWFQVFMNSSAGSAIIGAIGVIIGGLIALATNSYSAKMQMKQSRNEKMRIKYEQQLYEFYNPLVFLLERTTAEYHLFALEEKKADKQTRTLTLLLDGHEFSEYDRSLLEEIIEYNNQISKLITSNSRFIDNELVSPLVELVNHYALIERAYKGNLQNNTVNREHTYPRDILSKLKDKQKSIVEELNKL